MSIEILEAKAELKDLVDTFSNLADVFEIIPVTPYPDSYDECL